MECIRKSQLGKIQHLPDKSWMTKLHVLSVVARLSKIQGDLGQQLLLTERGVNSKKIIKVNCTWYMKLNTALYSLGFVDQR